MDKLTNFANKVTSVVNNIPYKPIIVGIIILVVLAAIAVFSISIFQYVMDRKEFDKLSITDIFNTNYSFVQDCLRNVILVFSVFGISLAILKNTKVISNKSTNLIDKMKNNHVDIRLSKDGVSVLNPNENKIMNDDIVVDGVVVSKELEEK
jgi:hypothetical protein